MVQVYISCGGRADFVHLFLLHFFPIKRTFLKNFFFSPVSRKARTTHKTAVIFPASLAGPATPCDHGSSHVALISQLCGFASGVLPLHHPHPVSFHGCPQPTDAQDRNYKYLPTGRFRTDLERRDFWEIFLWCRSCSLARSVRFREISLSPPEREIF